MNEEPHKPHSNSRGIGTFARVKKLGTHIFSNRIRWAFGGQPLSKRLTRIVSLLPSATEIVYALGLGNSLVGVSHECDYPEDAKGKPKIIEPIFDTTKLSSERIDTLVVENMRLGKSIYRIRFEELKKADPDLIITQELCDVCAIGAADVLEAVNRLGKQVKVLSLNPHTLADVQDDIRKVAGATDRTG